MSERVGVCVEFHKPLSLQRLSDFWGSGQPGDEGSVGGQHVGVVDADHAPEEGDDQAGGRGQVFGENWGGGFGGPVGFVVEDFGGEALGGEGEDPDGHEHQGQADGEDADGGEGQGDAFGADAGEHDAGGRRAGDHAAGDAEEDDLFGGDPAGSGGRMRVVVIVGMRVGVSVRVGMIVVMRMGMMV